MCESVRASESVSVGDPWVEGPEHSSSICSFNNADGPERSLIRYRDRDRERQKTTRRQERDRDGETGGETGVSRRRTSLCVFVCGSSVD